MLAHGPGGGDSGAWTCSRPRESQAPWEAPILAATQRAATGGRVLYPRHSQNFVREAYSDFTG